MYVCMYVCGGGGVSVCVFLRVGGGGGGGYKVISNANIVNKKESRASLNFPVHLIEE